jgi:hypothetical protein
MAHDPRPTDIPRSGEGIPLSIEVDPIQVVERLYPDVDGGNPAEPDTVSRTVMTDYLNDRYRNESGVDVTTIMEPTGKTWP